MSITRNSHPIATRGSRGHTLPAFGLIYNLVNNINKNDNVYSTKNPF